MDTCASIFKAYPLTARLILFAGLPLFAVMGICLLYVRSGLPPEELHLSSDDVRDPVKIRRDGAGVAFIAARTDADVFFALGFAHAQDRSWQLETQRRLARGRLSEILGSDFVQQDKWMRTLGLYESAAAAWPQLSEPAKDSLRHYAAGINAWLQTDPVLPPEFIALGVRPESWTELDSLAWVKMFALVLGGNMWNELSRLIASEHLDAEQQRDLLHLVDVRETDLSIANGTTALRDLTALGRNLETELRIGGDFVGSNAWALSGRLGSQEAAILANDVHLGLQTPSLWYVAHLEGDTLDVAGMTLVGVPVVIFGRNRRIAWGGTNLMADVQDLYFEQVDPQDPARYWRDGKWERFETRTEFINVRAQFPSSLRRPVEPVRVQVRTSSHGPIISDVLQGSDYAIALQWVALQPDDLSYEAFFRVGYASDWTDFKEAFQHYVAPALNVLYADVNGNIGSLAVGRIPVRTKGRGRVPVPGWSGEYGWSGYVPFTDWFQRYNPVEGYIVSANDRIVDDAYPYFVSDDWAPPHRANRIRDLLKGRNAEELSFEHSMRIQGDTVDLGAAALASLLKRIPVTSEQQRQALRRFEGWQGDMSANSEAATIFHVWTKYLREEIFADALVAGGSATQDAAQLKEIVANTTDEQLLRALTSPASIWCDNERSGARSCAEIVEKALDRALRELRRLRGTRMSAWRWGEVHEAVYSHLPFSRAKALAPLFENRIGNGGSGNTINLASAVYREGVGYEQSTGPAFRQVLLMSAAASRHWFMNSTGQSGHPASEHYADMVAPFRDVQYAELPDSMPDSDGPIVTISPE